MREDIMGTGALKTGAYSPSPNLTGPHAPSRPSGFCSGEHSFYMASEVEIPERGKLALLGFCTHCAAPLHLEFDILKNKE